MHRKRADVTAWKEQRRNHMPIGRHDQTPLGGQRQQSAIVALAQVFVVEGTGEQFVDQLRCHTAPCTVRHVDAAMLEIDRADVVFALAHAVTTGISRKRP